jgi:putative cardiolipin synthase
MTASPFNFRPVRGHLALLLVGLLSACAGVPFDYPKTETSALPTAADTRLGQLAENWRAEHGAMNGFIGLGDGIQALGARLKMIEGAQASIDAQYFIIKKDRAGALFAGKLLRAADRGVRVRLLVDDIFTPGTDEAFTLLNTHPNIEVRLFNPVSRQSLFKYWGFLVDFQRANRRMHNKSFTVDNAMTIVGGRNIGEEYFELNQDVKFDDYEVLAVGPVVKQVNDGFDEFWNSQLSVPMDAFDIEVDPAELERWRGLVEEATANPTGIYQQAVNSTFINDVREGRIKPVVADAVMITDSPDKLLVDVGEEDFRKLALEIVERFQAAEREIIIITPYFIPREGGTALVESLLERGVRVVIVTNSLASTNHLPVHSAYSRYRKRLLQAGAEIYEVRARGVETEANAWGNAPELVTLHSKATVIDRETIFIGSLNFDPRSIDINTEMGLFIANPAVGEPFTKLIMDDLPRVAYRVTLDEQDKLRWTYEYGDITEVETKEPLSGWWRRTQSVLYRVLPEGQL